MKKTWIKVASKIDGYGLVIDLADVKRIEPIDLGDDSVGSKIYLYSEDIRTLISKNDPNNIWDSITNALPVEIEVNPKVQ